MEAEQTSKKDHGVLYLGIDLGTSRTSVAASNGQRVTISSHVGYPKDVVSRKLLKKDVLFGEEAVQHRLSCRFSTKRDEPHERAGCECCRSVFDLRRNDCDSNAPLSS